jgi:5-hydroxyisourate hydrolase
VRLEAADGTLLAEGRTDADGRLQALEPRGAGDHVLRFDTAAYLGADAFFPEAALRFRVTDPRAKLHVPLLLSPFGYSTYRGS